MSRRRLAPHLAWIVCALCCAACTDPVDRAAKQRIFSPEAPPLAVSSAKEPLPPQEVASNHEVARRILGMGAAEVTERLGPHQHQANVRFEWTTGTRTLKQEEVRTLLAGPGGMGGDFHATMENARRQGMEVVRVGGQVYARSRYGKFRHRQRDRGLAERAREEVSGALRDADHLFHGRLVLSQSGTATVEGRTAWKYDVTLGPARPPKAEAALPKVQYGRGGPDPDTLRRLRFYQEREPTLLEGEVWVDAETSVVLKARLEGTLTAPGDESGRVTLRLAVSSSISAIGKDPAISTPEGFLPDADKPEGITGALDAFGIPRGKPGAEDLPQAEPDDDG